jgi:hypothetical protein
MRGESRIADELARHRPLGIKCAAVSVAGRNDLAPMARQSAPAIEMR